MAPCPYCKRDLVPTDRFCRACRVALHWDPQGRPVQVHPTIRPGQLVRRADFRATPIFGYTQRQGQQGTAMSFAPHPTGLLFAIHSPVSPTFPDNEHVVRDACIRASFTVLDPGSRIGLVARRSAFSTGNGRIGYALNVSVDKKMAWISAAVEAEGLAQATVLSTISNAACIGGVGAFNVLELRVQGPGVHAFINDVPLIQLHDPLYGIGVFGLRVGREAAAGGPPTRVICHGYEMFTVGQ